MNSFIFIQKVVHRADECKIHHFDPHNRKVYNVKQKSGKFFIFNNMPFRNVCHLETFGKSIPGC